jgi:TPP-dependent 2-oxoacid decarboxylase
MVEHISVASTVLMDAKSAASEIDRVLNGMLFIECWQNFQEDNL